MSPLAATAAPTTGGSKSAEATSQTTEWVNLAHLILQNAGVHMSAGKVLRLVSRFENTVQRNGWPFLDYVCNAIQVTAEQRRKIRDNPDIARAISYADPTGEAAVNNVIRRGK